MMTHDAGMLLELDRDRGAATEVALGPARVIRTAGNRVEIDFQDRPRWATLALCLPYTPVPGDVLLAIGQRDATYIIGVLSGEGPTTLTVPADLRIRAPHGAIDLTAARGVRVKAPAIKLAADHLELVATTLFERAAEATRWIRGALTFRAGQLRMNVDDGYSVRAGAIDERAADSVHIDGRKIHLG